MIKGSNFYFQTLFDSWKAVWKNKALWFLALFSLFLGSGQWSNFLSRDFANIFRDEGVIFNLYNIFSVGGFFHNLKEKITSDPFSFLILLLIVFSLMILFILFVFIAVTAQGGLVYSIFKIGRKEKTDIHESLRIGNNNFWQVLSLNIILKFIVWTLSSLLGFLGLLVFLKKASFSILLFSALSIGIILFLILISFVFKYSLSFIILKGRNCVDALGDGFKLFFKNWIISLEMAAFLFIVNFVFAVLATWVIRILLIPISSVGTFSLYLSSSASFGFYFIFIPIVISLVILWFFSVLSAYNYFVWTTLFIKLTGKGKITSFVGSLFSHLKGVEEN